MQRLLFGSEKTLQAKSGKKSCRFSYVNWKDDEESLEFACFHEPPPTAENYFCKIECTSRKEKQDAGNLRLM